MGRKDKKKKNNTYYEDTSDLHKSFTKNRKNKKRKNEKRYMREIQDGKWKGDNIDNFEKW